MKIIDLKAPQIFAAKLSNMPEVKSKWIKQKAIEIFNKEVIIYGYRIAEEGLWYITGVHPQSNKTFGYYVPAYYEIEYLQDKLEEFQATLALTQKDQGLYLKGNELLGSDPEIFIEDSSGIIIPAYEFLGSKGKPDKTYAGYYGNTDMYWDGFQAEFTTQPVNCLAYHVDSVYCGIRGVLEKALKHNSKAKLSIKTVMDIPEDILRTAKEEHVSFGCMPSLNAYGMKGIVVPPRDISFRPAGGHIHLGLGLMNEDQAKPIVQALDMILGVACVSMFKNFDDVRRRILYGLAGEYRLPKHGLEYRVLSNAWTFHPLIMNLVFDLARRAVYFQKKGFMKDWKGNTEQAIEIINSYNYTKAQESLQANKDIYIKMFKSTYMIDNASAEALFNIFVNGMESVLRTPDNIAANWNIGSEWATHNESEGKQVKTTTPLLLSNKKVA